MYLVMLQLNCSFLHYIINITPLVLHVVQNPDTHMNTIPLKSCFMNTIGTELQKKGVLLLLYLFTTKASAMNSGVHWLQPFMSLTKCF